MDSRSRESNPQIIDRVTTSLSCNRSSNPSKSKSVWSCASSSVILGIEVKVSRVLRSCLCYLAIALPVCLVLSVLAAICASLVLASPIVASLAHRASSLRVESSDIIVKLTPHCAFSGSSKSQAYYRGRVYYHLEASRSSVLTTLSGSVAVSANQNNGYFPPTNPRRSWRRCS